MNQLHKIWTPLVCKPLWQNINPLHKIQAFCTKYKPFEQNANPSQKHELLALNKKPSHKIWTLFDEVEELATCRSWTLAIAYRYQMGVIPLFLACAHIVYVCQCACTFLAVQDLNFSKHLYWHFSPYLYVYLCLPGNAGWRRSLRPRSRREGA